MLHSNSDKNDGIANIPCLCYNILIMQNAELPSGVSMLTAFSASDEADPARLTYPQLGPTAEEALQKDSALWHSFLEAEEGSLDETSLARRMAVGYLVLTSAQLHGTSPGRQSLASERFTQHSIELYGAPEHDYAQESAARQLLAFDELESNPDVNQERLGRIRATLRSLVGPEGPELAEAHDYTPAAEAMKNVLYARYGDTLATFDDIEQENRTLSLKEVISAMQTGLDSLIAKDLMWSDWKAAESSGEGLSTSVKTETLKVGRKGNYEANRLKPLFVHEALVHGMRGMNGRKTGVPQLEKGLPGNLDTEEGIGTFLEYAVSGVIPDKIIDRYTSVALALGHGGQPAMTRAQLQQFQLDRLVVRKQAAGKPVDTEALSRSASNHADRIYRGSLGTDLIAVNTKDIAYFTGFTKMAEYITEELKTKTPEEVFDYIMQGCFDPTDEAHRDFVQKVTD